jgi:hypothetical protein
MVSLTIALLSGLVFAALAFVAYVMWPRWAEPPATTDAPPLPIVVANVIFQVPPAAIRQKVQRRPGAHDRIDLVFLWPELTPAAALSPDDPKRPPPTAARVFVTIASAPAAVTPADRLRSLYPRYAEPAVGDGPDGLGQAAFRDNTPYRGEDVLFDRDAPERFVVRCTRDQGAVQGTCLYERLIGSTSMMVRFPRGWLDTWRELVSGTDRLIDQLRPAVTQ